jgi:nicotinate-nucleotide adenylyltransferase
MHGLAVSDLELKRPGPSFTIDTARLLRAAYGPDAEIRFIIGSDSLAELPLWREAEDLVRCADFAIASRRDAPLTDRLWAGVAEKLGAAAAAKLRASVAPVERVDVSSTLVRRLLRKGEAIRGYLRSDVERYIRSKGLYGAPPHPIRRGRIVTK